MCIRVGTFVFFLSFVLSTDPCCSVGVAVTGFGLAPPNKGGIVFRRKGDGKIGDGKILQKNKASLCHFSVLRGEIDCREGHQSLSVDSSDEEEGVLIHNCLSALRQFAFFLFSLAAVFSLPLLAAWGKTAPDDTPWSLFWVYEQTKGGGEGDGKQGGDEGPWPMSDYDPKVRINFSSLEEARGIIIMEFYDPTYGLVFPYREYDQWKYGDSRYMERLPRAVLQSDERTEAVLADLVKSLRDPYSTYLPAPKRSKMTPEGRDGSAQRGREKTSAVSVASSPSSSSLWLRSSSSLFSPPKLQRETPVPSVSPNVGESADLPVSTSVKDVSAMKKSNDAEMEGVLNAEKQKRPLVESSIKGPFPLAERAPIPFGRTLAQTRNEEANLMRTATGDRQTGIGSSWICQRSTQLAEREAKRETDSLSGFKKKRKTIPKYPHFCTNAAYLPTSSSSSPSFPLPLPFTSRTAEASTASPKARAPVSAPSSLLPPVQDAKEATLRVAADLLGQDPNGINGGQSISVRDPATSSASASGPQSSLSVDGMGSSRRTDERGGAFPKGNGKGVEVGVLRVKLFARRGSDEFMDALKEMDQKGVGGFVIDVRGTPGGVIQEAALCASALLADNSEVVYTVVDVNGFVDTYTVGEQAADRHFRGLLADASKPVVVLVDGETASAAEVFVSALRDNGRGVIAGPSRTFGKSLIQHAFRLPNRGTLRLTVAEFLSPKKQHFFRHASGQPGIGPDISSFELRTFFGMGDKGA
uniref:Tail specific protease domain-containing protein n=1 Tax=Chromera velia CCMP2878 TaxID=1169474 RepID=A0A0G4GID3_9ALVE|eukprot:Cvel_21963.t1-p1 / transcript=Cvel_21963.t1 / gene=Cvel_21963 / organism=Chromera_velia_CCMP2878 / gene_product=Carboxyl-terminal-processing protease, putative / transcript_product=Carboxyl-terminal-processing protease, putative / location=Cvel_scaffold2110:26130-30148(+) / protein_length=753 / sequence_SO=supercontig / SO=protein_coding / is_pseudo=false